MPPLPNFFIIGAPKTGTTSLFHYLNQHPDVFMSSVKEPHYFASEVREANIAPHRRAGIAQTSREAHAFLDNPGQAKLFR